MRTSRPLIAGALALASLAVVPGTALAVPTPPADPTASRHSAVIGKNTLRSLAEEAGIEFGVAVNTDLLANNGKYRHIVNTQYSSVTAENVMKWEALNPAPGVYDWAAAEELIANAEANGQVVRGHTLVWHNQLPTWLTTGDYSAEELRTILENHVRKVAGHFAGRIQQWDVVNEIFNDDDAGSFRETIWYQAYEDLGLPGEQYVADVFRWAHQADRNASLFYNDYNIEGINAKSTAAYNLVKRLRSEGVPIHGIGIQGHLGTQYGFPGDVPENMARFAALGMDVAVTEADVRSILPMDNPKTQAHARGFSVLMQGCLLVRRCTSFTVWGFSDKYQWVPGVFNGEGSAAIYDENFVPKVSYRALQQDMVLANRRR